MAINKVIYDGNTLIDLTSDTVDASTLLVGYTAHDRSGAVINGAFDSSIYVLKAGDTMTGALTLSGAPTSNLHAATKKYVDDAVGAITDTKVTQTVTTTSAAYPILFGASSITLNSEATTKTEGARISGAISVNPATGTINARRIHTGTTSQYGRVVLGNGIANGTAGCSHGEIYIYGKGDKYARIYDKDGVLTANRELYFPNISGYITIIDSITGTAGNGKTITSFTNSNGEVDITFGNISITKSQVSDFPTLATVATSGSYNDLSNKPTIPTITDTYSGTSSNGMSGKAVKSAIDALDGSITGSAGSGKTLTAFSQTNGVVSATFGNISITKSQVSDFPTLATVATSGSYNDLTNKPTTFVLKAGDTMTGELIMDNKAVKVNIGNSAIATFQAIAQSGVKCTSSYISGACAHGMWSTGYATSLTDTTTYVEDGAWIIYRTTGGDICIPKWGSIGTASKPIYFDAYGKPLECNTIPTITDTYSGTSSDGMSGKAVKSAIDALDGSVTGSAGAGKTLTAFSQTNGVVTATFGNISITKSQVSDFPTLATVATSGSYTDLSNKPTITDENVLQTQTLSSNTSTYPILFSATSHTAGNDPSTTTTGARISGGIFYQPSTATLYVRKIHSSTTTAYSRVVLGNGIADGTAGACDGRIVIYGKGTKYFQLADNNNALTADRTLNAPDVSGTIATLEHIYSISGRVATIAANSNLNSSAFTVPGRYYCSSTNAATLTNSPVTTTGFVMDVENLVGSAMVEIGGTASNYRRRTIRGATSSDCVYIQICYTDSSKVETYNSWIRMASTSTALLKSGGTMTGALTLSGAPTSNLHAATKKYVDDAVSGLSGTVTSVEVTGSKGISVSGSPITTSGTIAVSVSTSSGTATRNTTNTSAGVVKYNKYGRVVNVYTDTNITCSGTLNSGKVICTLPKPAQITTVGEFSFGSYSSVPFAINTDGELYPLSTISGTGRVGFTYISAS